MFKDFKFETVNDNMFIEKYFGVSEIVKIPAYVNDKKIVGIGEKCFKDQKIKTVIIPNTINFIAKSAFCGCANLTSVKIPDSVTSIGISTFAFCNSLTSVTIPDGVKSIGKRAFLLCDSLKSVIIPESVTSIGYYAFYSCDSLTDITILNKDCFLEFQDIPNYTVIHGYIGSTTEAYANKNGNKFEKI